VRTLAIFAIAGFVAVSGCVEKNRPQQDDAANESTLPFSAFWNLTGPQDVVALLVEAEFANEGSCEIQYFFAGSAANRPIYALIGVRMPARHQSDDRWMWSYAMPTVRAEAAGVPVASTQPGISWSARGDLPTSLVAGDDLAFLAIVHDVRDSSDIGRNQLSIVCDIPARANLRQGSQAVSLSPGSSPGLQSPGLAVSAVDTSFMMTSDFLVAGCYCPLVGGNQLGSHDVQLDLPKNTERLHFEGPTQKSVFLESESGPVRARVTSSASGSSLILQVTQLEPVEAWDL
jgi:hypothetical protein